MQEMEQLSRDFFALSPEEKEVNKIKPGTNVGYGRLFETSKTIGANWVDRITIWSYGEQTREQPCNPPKPERFRYLSNLLFFRKMKQFHSINVALKNLWITFSIITGY